MSVLVFVELAEGKVKPSSLEAVSYGSQLASMLGNSTTAVILGNLDADALEKVGASGADKILHADDAKLNLGNIMAYSSAIKAAAEKEGSDHVIFAKSSLGDAVSARLGITLGASCASNVTSLPNLDNGFEVTRSIYTGKAFAQVKLTGSKRVLAIKKNSVPVREDGGAAEVEAWSPSISDTDFASVVTKTDKTVGQVLLPEADLVVSAGRGLKGPENWGMIEELATTLGAATGCSKPVSDMDWRPHHEHVGQTGVKVSPTLYIAIGISGAIQHLAGVNSSKYIVVINKDPEAPFFKAADYGIVGDAFDVVPKLNEALKNS